MRRPCLRDRCWELTERTYCPAHQPKRTSRPRPSAHARGYDRAYRRIREHVPQRDGRTCAYCGGTATTTDHVIPRSRGGSNDESNLVACCATCNSRKGERAWTSQ